MPSQLRSELMEHRKNNNDLYQRLLNLLEEKEPLSPDKEVILSLLIEAYAMGMEDHKRKSGDY